MAQGAFHIERDARSGELLVRVELAGAELQGPTADSQSPSASGDNVETVIAQLQSLIAARQAARSHAAKSASQGGK
jgi:hypothetical protein